MPASCASRSRPSKEWATLQTTAVVVDSGGTLLGIGIEGVSNEVCEAIMAAYAAARRDAGEQVISASQAAFGENYAGIERMRSLYGVPDPEEPEDEAPHPWIDARRP